MSASDWVCLQCNRSFTGSIYTPCPHCKAPTEPSPAKPSILTDAAAIISGPRRESYGPVEESFEQHAAVWSLVFKHPVTPAQVALCMLGLKFCREANAHSRDNLVDICGYAALLDQLHAANPMKEPAK